MKITPQFFITSDTHFFHSNLWKIWGRPEDSDERIVRNWNSVVKKDDKVLHLGDVVFSNKEKAIEIIKRLNGTKYLIRGNHDGQSETWFEDCGFITIEPIFKRFKNKYDQWLNVLFTHEPVFGMPQGWVNIHGHLHGNNHREYQDLELQKERMVHFDAGVDASDFTPTPLYEILNTFFADVPLPNGNFTVCPCICHEDDNESCSLCLMNHNYL